MKFVSHLDMNRFMSRQLRLSKLPIWYTEGFNPHPYVTFLLPLSLGFESEYEIMDIRLTDDDYPLPLVKEKLSSVMPSYIEVFDVKEPLNKPGKIGFAKYKITFKEYDDDFVNQLSKFMLSDSIIVEKVGKKGKVKTIDVASKIKDFTIHQDNNFVQLTVTLPAGSNDSVNPTLLLSAFKNIPHYSITKIIVYDVDMRIFQ